MELEERLRDLGGEIDWPATPELRPQVTRRLAALPRWYERRWPLAAAAALVILALLVAYTPTRTAIADWLNLHVNIRRTNVLPTPSPLPSGSLGSQLGLGSPTTLDAARTGVHWTVLVPGTLGQPDAVYLQTTEAPPQGEVSLVYATRPGIPVARETGVSVLITEARGAVDTQFFGKMLGPDTTIVEVTVNGHRGWWISGAPHQFVFIDADGNVRGETLRLATNTLLIDDGGTIVRIEGELTKQQALDIAASLG
jgi:hypothetical protein